ncbi:MAG: hypothetical protein NT129_05910 [Candidatus Aenigmarchaeota archaeon]|nr:hypothetical protein [Candidatus Aenigmarchaeota archaeon]
MLGLDVRKGIEYFIHVPKERHRERKIHYQTTCAVCGNIDYTFNTEEVANKSYRHEKCKGLIDEFKQTCQKVLNIKDQ